MPVRWIPQLLVLAAWTGRSATAIASATDILYHVTPLGYLPGGYSVSFPTDINNIGQVCGDCGGWGGLQEAFRWDPAGGMIGLGYLPGPCSHPVSTAEAINDLGHVAGVGQSFVECRNEAFLWKPESGMIALGDLPGFIFSSWARGINNLNQVTGYSWSDSAGPVEEAFLWQVSTGMIGLGDLPGGQFISIAEAINDSSWITGWSCSYAGCEAFLWTPEGGMIGLGDLVPDPYADSTGMDINNLGQVVGIARSKTGHGQAFLWDRQAGMIGLGFLHSASDAVSRAEGVNDLGEVVGLAWRGAYVDTAAFVWDAQRGMRALNDLLDVSAQPPYHQMGAAYAINNRGQIVCRGSADDGVLLTPFVLGDMDCDGEVDYDDIGPFVLALVDLPAHAQQYPDCHGDWAGDVNQDAAFNAFDIDPFVDLLIP